MQTNAVEIKVLTILIISFLPAIVLTILFTFFYLMFKKRRSKEKGDLQRLFYLLIEKVIFNESTIFPKNDGRINLPMKFQKKLKKRFARSVMKDVILDSKNNLTETYGENLQALYNQTGLKKDALKNLRFGKRWYIKAGAIQDLSRMNQTDCIRHIYKYVNNKNKYIRMEAQSAMINLWGFRGLRFLNFIVHPVSEWQQIILLRQLSYFTYEEFQGIEKWLQSPNDSVVIFALKLVRVYHRFELYDAVAKTLEHPNLVVRRNCIITLAGIYTEDTASLMISHFDPEARICKLAILSALQEAGNEQSIPFLMKELKSGENEYKLKAAQAIVAIGKREGLELIASQPFSDLFPWNAIITQLKEETA